MKELDGIEKMLAFFDINADETGIGSPLAVEKPADVGFWLTSLLFCFERGGARQGRLRKG